ncbi:hypothetical protein JL106_18620 [Nakamurella sp. YIM 132084]|uniref:MFS transporter n=1 Tax=Nakamurella leprariae TaxID=2803911 RepID=A0A938YB64_9ACTN|nr:hypothetical protein [Nakamurella leprariae]MBM9469306.1 hypothetical protein [Nakamurella leprariae]
MPFLLSAIMVMIGLYVRLRLEETPVFARAVARGQKVRAPLATVFRTSRRPLILGTFVMVGTYTLFSLMTTWILSYATGATDAGLLGWKYSDFLVLQLVSVLFFAAGGAGLGPAGRPLRATVQCSV